MPQASFIPIIMMIVLIIITQRNERAVIRRLLKKRKTEDTQMLELAKTFINKECIIYTFNSQLTGTIKAVDGSGLLLEKDGNVEAVNLDFVVRIREYPRGKNGKKKSVVLD